MESCEINTSTPPDSEGVETWMQRGGCKRDSINVFGSWGRRHAWWIDSHLTTTPIAADWMMPDRARSSQLHAVSFTGLGFLAPPTDSGLQQLEVDNYYSK